MKILLVDDDIDDMELFREAISEIGDIDCHCFSNGMDAVVRSKTCTRPT